DAHELKKVTEDVLPKIEKFLESPEEKRLRRMRAGVITAAIGLGASLVAVLLTTTKPPDDVTQWLFGWAGLALVTFFIGRGLVINGMLFSHPRKGIEDQSRHTGSQNLLDGYSAPQLRSGEAPPTFRAQTTSNLSQAPGASVTEHPTLNLKNER